MSSEMQEPNFSSFVVQNPDLINSVTPLQEIAGEFSTDTEIVDEGIVRMNRRPPGSNNDFGNIHEPQEVQFNEEFYISPSGRLLRQYILSEGFGDHHIEVYDNWISNTAYMNLTSRMLTFKDGRVVCYENPRVFPPKYTREGRVLPMTPQLAREQGVTYGSDWHVDVVMRRGDCSGEIIDKRESICIGTIPVMLKSSNCILHKKSPRELALLGEDPKDPGGYFVVSGVEKVVLLQEQLALNRIFLMHIDTKGTAVIRMTVNTNYRTALIELALDKKNHNKIEIRFPSMRRVDKQGENYKSVNVLRVFRILGITDLNEIQSIIALFIKPEYLNKSIKHLAATLFDIDMFPDDIGYIMTEMGKVDLTEDQQLETVKHILDTDLFPHLNNLQGPDGESVDERGTRISTSKVYLLAIMTARFLEYIAGYRQLDDRNSWSNKKVEGAGRMMGQLFRNAWKKTLGIAQGGIEMGSIKDLNGVVEKMRHSVITETFRDSFITGKWGVKGTQMKNNITQTLVRDNIPATLAHINTVDVSISRTDRQEVLRLIQSSQWGFIDPVSTPDGENAGLLKNLAITAKISLERTDDDIIRFLIGDESKGLEPYVSLDPRPRQGSTDKIIVNGKFLGWCDGERVKDELIKQRRYKYLPPDMSVVKEDDWVYVDISPSRLVRPLLIVSPNQQLVIDTENLRGRSTQDLLRGGAMEYVSAWEQEYIKIATSIDKIKERQKLIDDYNNTFQVATQQLEAVKSGEEVLYEDNGDMIALTLDEANSRVQDSLDQLETLKNNLPYTHCELDPKAILGVAAALIPWPNHNQAPRNTYQVSMGKQALGVYHSNHQNRFDGKIKILAYATRPIVETEMYDIIGLDERGSGQTVNVAFMAWPFTEEDSFVFKKEFLDSGGLRMYKYLTYKTIVKNSSGVTETLLRPTPRAGEPENRYKFIQQAENGNPVNGLPMIGAPLRQSDCVIGKEQYDPSTNEKRNESVILRVGDEGVVDKVLVTTDGKDTVVTVKLRVMRVPQEGDKNAPRNAQKGTIGLVISDIDLPFTDDDGISPDVIVNPSCFMPDTPVLLKNGLARPLIAMEYDGGDHVWSFDPEKYRIVTSKSIGYESRGIRDVVKVTFSDGRVIRCTPDHKFPVLKLSGNLQVRDTLPVEKITSDMIVMATIDGVLDNPTEEERAKELQWSLDAGTYSFNMKNKVEREKSLAFARIIGLICTDGCLCGSGGKYYGCIYTGAVLDAEVVLDDIELITSKRPSISPSISDTHGSTLNIAYPKEFARSIATIKGMTAGRRTNQIPEWPEFVFDKSCPKSIVREFLGGMFGGDGWAPYLTTNKQDGQGTVTFNPPAISQSSIALQWDELREKMEDIVNLLEYVGVKGARVEKPKPYTTPSNNKEMLTCVVQLPRGTAFGDKVGFRYCVQKMNRMAAYQSYMRYLENVKRQNDFIIQRASELYDAGSCKRSLQIGLDMAREELFAKETPFNEYYSNATLDQVRNRRRKDRFNELMKWDYSRIEDAEKYLRKIGVYHWFRTEDRKERADYIVLQTEESMPYFKLHVQEIRPIGEYEVFDIGVAKTHTLVASGVAAMNCIPSRMTISYFHELIAGKSATYSGTRINASSFSKFHFDQYREVLRQGPHLKDEFGYEDLRSGTSGKEIPTRVYMGPIFFQALKHHVKDKAQVRSTGQVKPMTHQPPKGRGNRGGLRLNTKPLW